MRSVFHLGRGLAVLGFAAAVASPSAAQTPPQHPAPDDTVAVRCAVAAGATLTDCTIANPERLTPVEQARVLERASRSTTDPALPVGARRTFGITEAIRDFAAPPALAPRLALVREDTLVGVGECIWKAIGAHGQSVVTGGLRIGASMQNTRANMQAEPTWAAAVAQCDPHHGEHVALFDMVVPAYAMKAASRDHLAKNGLQETSMRQAMAALPVVRAALELRTIAVLRQSAEPPAVDWVPYLTRIHLLSGDPMARYAQLYFQAEAIENVLIYQQLRAW